MAAVINADDCVGCGTCVDACPAEVIELQGDVAVIANVDDCVDCGACADECPSDCITV